MNKLIMTLVAIAPLMLAGCVRETVYYTPSHTSRYVHTTGYYGGPYWSDAYYYGYDDIGNVGYWGMYDSYRVY